MQLNLRIKGKPKNKTSLRKIRKRAKIILGVLGCEKASLSILITDDPSIQQINREWLGRDRPTDVIAFSQLEGQPAPTDFIGDVVVSLDTAADQANSLGHSLDHELDRLISHGILHIMGYDHVHGGRQAKKMREMEDRLISEIEKEPA